MLGIGDFFKRIQGAHAREVLIRNIVKDSVRKQTGIDVPIESISFSSSTLVLNGLGSAARSVIFIKKAAILDEVNRGQSFRKLDTIR